MYKYKKVSFEHVSEVHEHKKFTLGKHDVNFEKVWDYSLLAEVLGPWMQNHRLYNGIGEGRPTWDSIRTTLEKLSISIPEDVQAAALKEYEKGLNKMRKKGETNDCVFESLEDSVRATVVWDWILKEIIRSFKRASDGDLSAGDLNESRDVRGTTLFGAFFHHFWC